MPVANYLRRASVPNSLIKCLWTKNYIIALYIIQLISCIISLRKDWRSKTRLLLLLYGFVLKYWIYVITDKITIKKCITDVINFIKIVKNSIAICLFFLFCVISTLFLDSRLCDVSCEVSLWFWIDMIYYYECSINI